jgi:endonuclease/exonuclease/phosphatase family metal-dependent hydrolase
MPQALMRPLLPRHTAIHWTCFKMPTPSNPLFNSILAVLCAVTAAAADEPAPLDTLRVLSYNIRHGRGMDQKVDFDRIAKVIAGTKPDLVALQEVDRGVGRSGKVDAPGFLGKTLGMHHKFGSSMPYQGGEYGLAVLSRFPVAEARVHKLPGGGEPRIALEVEVDLPKAGGSKTRISFVSVHFDWTSPDDTRLAQASALIEVLRSRKHPVIVAGDFNDVRGSRTLDAFAAEFHLPESAGPTVPADQPRSEIDFITWRGLPRMAELEVIGENVASDHRPVLAAISLAAAATGVRGKQHARLAREILDDRTLHEVHQIPVLFLGPGIAGPQKHRGNPPGIFTGSGDLQIHRHRDSR